MQRSIIYLVCAKRWADCVSRMITQTEEYQRAECDLIVYGQSMFNPAKVLAEIEPLDSRREPWQACDAGDVPVVE